ncbi:ATP-binding protein [Algoriphagus sp. AK58]|uniref:sensor histidine kinase n=1 Tax=Algoriphagus sp. AK58 TaxID=1406877 RepID=UPI00164FF292|nr:ATP-binding protein [Algoriphagus sp. AK58]MBC6366973.1 diguanylate cyclase [Algoriphagus sp. AK58]
MLKKIKLLLSFLMVFTLGQVFVLAQTFKYNLQPKGVRLPVQNILQIEQDTLGQMWFSTTRGVVYSDGIQTFNLPDTLIRKFIYKISILKDEDGVMWLYNASGIPSVFEGVQSGWREEYFEADLTAHFSNRINFLSFGEKENKYFFLDGGGYLIYWKNGEKVKQRVQRDYNQTGILLSVLNLQGKILLNFQKGAYLLDGSELSPYQFRGVPLPSPPVLVKKSPNGTYYFLGNNYLAKGPAAEFPVEIVDQNFSTSEIITTPYFSLDFYGDHVFYHYNSHFRRYHPSGTQPIEGNITYLLRTNYLQTLFVDREGILWLGTARGLANTNNQLFQNFGNESTQFLGEEFTAIENLGDGAFLLGFNNGVQLWEKGKIITLYKDSNPPGSPNQRVVNFSTDKYGQVWFSANWGGVGRFDKKSRSIRFYSPPKGLNISSVQVDGDSLFIIAPEKVFHASIKGIQSGNYGKDLSDEILKLIGINGVYFRKAARLKNGKILVLRASRLENQYPIQETGKYFLAEGYGFIEREEGGLLLATEYGLKIFREGYVGYYIYSGKTVTNPVFTLTMDKDARLWLGTDNGVYVMGDNKIRHFNETNGLVGDEINRGALLQVEDGRILIGTQKGLSIYYPDEMISAKGAPKAYLRHASLGSETLLGDKKIKVPFSQNTLQVDFLASGFDESRELWIHYRLVDSEDKSWDVIKEPGNSQLFFNNIPYGTYRFELKASYDGVEFSDVISTPEFEILAPFYLRPAFVIFGVLFLVGIGVLVGQLMLQLQRLGILQTAVDKENKSKILAEKQFKNVWNSSQDSMILSLNGEVILTVNPAFARLMKREISELENQPVSTLFSNYVSNEKGIEELLVQLKNSSGQGITMQGPVEWKTGTLDMEIYNVLLEENFNGKALLLSVFKDLSAQKAAENRLKEAKEKAEEANRFKTSLLSNISHEIRTPLNGIIGGAEHIIMTREFDSELVSQLEIILESGERLLDTINSLLDMAKIEANKMPVTYTDTWVHSFLILVLRPLESLAQQKGLTLVRRFSGEDFLAKIDRRFVEMILNNLVSNAIKYSENGEVLIFVRKDNQSLIVEVLDSGVGMSADFQEKMFDPFEQESHGNNRLFEGTGLGLSITKNLVQLLGGKIEIWSVKNLGTKVRVEIPLPED